MRLTAERAELVLEALQLREFGYTQQMVAETLGVRRDVVTKWLLKYGHNGTLPQPHNGGLYVLHTRYGDVPLPHHPITLYPCRYEDADVPSEAFDLILTDPPYLVSAENMPRNNQNPLQRDFGGWDKADDDNEARVQQWAALIAKHLKLGATLYLFIGFRQSFLWQQALDAAGLVYNGLVVWHRSNPAPQIRKTRWCPAFDMVLFYSKGTPKTFRWIGQNEMHSVIRSRAPEVEAIWAGPICAGNEREWHPTQKPRWLLQKLMWVSSQPGDHIFDPFAGSGSTAFAALHLPGRHVTLIEPEPKYTGLIQSTAKEEFQCEIRLMT